MSKPFSGRVLLLEDNLIIAMDTEILLQELGASEVVLTSSVAEAMEALSGPPFDFVLMDVNLGDETSSKVAEAVIEAGTPFAFVTGYGETRELVSKFENPVILEKPYEGSALQRAMTEALGRKA